jgi:hypothetical protein
MSLFDEKQMRIECATIGAEIALKRLGLIKDEISQREAYRVFGQGKVRTWVNLGLVKKIKTGERNSKTTYSRIELETIKRLEQERKIKSSQYSQQ